MMGNPPRFSFSKSKLKLNLGPNNSLFHLFAWSYGRLGLPQCSFLQPTVLLPPLSPFSLHLRYQATHPFSPLPLLLYYFAPHLSNINTHDLLPHHLLDTGYLWDSSWHQDAEKLKM